MAMAPGIDGLIEEGEAFKRLGVASRTRRFHTGMAIAFLVTAVAGFGPSYYRKGVAAASTLTPLVHVHALLFTGWLLLLLTQSGLVAARRVDIHRRLGIAGALLAAAMVPIGLMTAIATARRMGIGLLVFQAGAIILFGAFVGAAIWKRRRPELHRRLILLATVSIMPPAIVRLPVVGGVPVLALLLSTVFVLAGIIHDYRSRARVHPVYVWGGLVLLLSAPLRLALGQTSAWQAFAHFLVG